MKQISIEQYMAGVWSLHLSSYLVASIPYLQVLSLILAMTVSIMTMMKLKGTKKNGK
jgi:hypothetical protein